MGMAKPYRVCAAFDSETTNIKDGLNYRAFPILYQFAEINCGIEELNNDNIDEFIELNLFRKHEELYSFLDNYISINRAFVPVVLVHNLGFDMYSLFPFFIDKTVKPLAKTARKPITFTVEDDNGNPLLVFLDTLGLYAKSLARMGAECNASKMTDSWDYSLIRTLETPLTDAEIAYAKQDLKTLLLYTAYFLRKNPDIDASEIGRSVLTKTGVVRAKRKKALYHLKGKVHNRQCGKLWQTHNIMQAPKSDDELYYMQACTRGGFTFCASEYASLPLYEDAENGLIAYDSTSMHPSMMVTHRFPIDFRLAEIDALYSAARIIQKIDVSYILANWAAPFPISFNAAFEFSNLRPKTDTIFGQCGIYPLASARLSTVSQATECENQAQAEFLRASVYKDVAVNPRIEFGKIVSADWCRLYLTELAFWEVCQCYEYDSVKPVGGYLTFKHAKPTDYSLLSVMRFYKAKNALKESMKDGNTARLQGMFPDSFVNGFSDCSDTEIKEYYQLAKADLNALFGIEATNEAKRDFSFTKNGLQLIGEDGIRNMPDAPKCWYQFGQRIVGYSRISQNIIMQLIAPYVHGIICGDTDSIKVYYPKCNIKAIERELKHFAEVIDNAKTRTCERVRKNYPAEYDSLDGIGHYVNDGEYTHFCAGWNKAYIYSEDGSKVKAVIAGMPTGNGIEDKASEIMQENGFDAAVNLLLGYNVSFDYSITRLNGRKHPKYMEMFSDVVTDYLGNVSHVYAPAALALYPEMKTIGDTMRIDNLRNSIIAERNNPNVNLAPVTVSRDSIKSFDLFL